MGRWEYRAYSSDGEVVQGRLTAESETAAFTTLEGLSLAPIELKPVVRRTKKHLFKLSPNDPQANLVFVRQLASLTGAGIPLSRAIESIGELQTDETERRRMLAIGQTLRQGRTLSEALQAHHQALPAYVFYLVQVGEATGDLSEALESASIQLARDLAVSRDIRSALTYPMFLVFFGVAAVVFMFAVVVPQFSTMLDRSDGNLPMISHIVITSGNYVRAHLFEAGLVFGLLITLFVVGGRNPQVAALLFQFTLSLPGIGNVIRLTESARWGSMMATLLERRVNITDAIAVANRIVQGWRLKKSLSRVEGALRRGTRLSDALEDFTGVDPRVIQMVRIGEQSGGLDQMLNASAELLRDEAETARKRFMGLIEPVAVLLIGGAVGLIVVGLMLAITSLYDRVL